jgi:hypothetical protein
LSLPLQNWIPKFMNLESRTTLFTNLPIGGTNTLKHPPHGRGKDGTRII